MYDFSLHMPFVADVVDRDHERMLKLWILFIHSDLRLTFVWVKFVFCFYACPVLEFPTIEFIKFGACVSVGVTQKSFHRRIPLLLLLLLLFHFSVVVDGAAMSVLSKYFNHAIASATCRDIVHPYTDSCFQAARGYFFRPVWTTVQFFAPLFAVSEW